MMIAVCADKGSPGCTTVALGLAACWESPAVLLEADPWGGDLGMRLRTDQGEVLPTQPTILSLASAARMSPDTDIRTHALRINDQLSVVPGVPMAESLSSMGQAWQPLVEVLRRASSTVVCDLGRLPLMSPAWPVARQADHVVVVGRGDLESVVRLRDRVELVTRTIAEQTGHEPHVHVAVVAPRRAAAAVAREMSEVLDHTDAGAVMGGVVGVPWDRAAVAALNAGQPPARLHRKTFCVSMRALGAAMAEPATEVAS